MDAGLNRQNSIHHRYSSPFERPPSRNHLCPFLVCKSLVAERVKAGITCTTECVVSSIRRSDELASPVGARHSFEVNSVYLGGEEDGLSEKVWERESECERERE